MSHTHSLRVKGLALPLLAAATWACPPAPEVVEDEVVAYDSMYTCVHRPGSRLTCPDTAMFRTAIALEQVLAVELSVFTTRGDTVRARYGPRDVDAIFLSWEPIERFALPYYERTQGGDSAAAIRRRYLGR